MIANDLISPEEHERWLRPIEAIEVLKIHFIREHAVRAIINRLAKEEIRAVARKIEYRQAGQKQTLRYFPIPAIMWKDSEAEHNQSNFWRFGDVDFEKYDNDFSNRQKVYWGCVDVRFESGGIKDLIPPNMVAEKTPDAPPYRAKPRPEPETKVPKVTREELRNWLQTWSSSDGATHDEIAEAAKVAFPNRRITRAPLRDAIGDAGLTQNRGNPAIRR